MDPGYAPFALGGAPVTPIALLATFFLASCNQEPPPPPQAQPVAEHDHEVEGHLTSVRNPLPVFQDEKTRALEDLLARYLRTGQGRYLQSFRTEAAHLVRGRPGFTYGWFLLAYGHRLAGDSMGEKSAMEQVDPASAHVYRRFFDKKSEELLTYLDWGAMDYCLRRHGTRLWDGPMLDGETQPEPGPITCDHLQLDSHQMPADQRLFLRINRSVSGDSADRLSLWSSAGKPATPQDLGRLLGLKAGQRVADLGAGLGYFTYPFAQVVGPKGKVYAIEIDPLFADVLEERKALEGIQNVEVVRNSGSSLGLPPSSVDVIWACEMITDVLSVRPGAPRNYQERFITPFFQNLFFTLEPGGMLVVVDLIRPPGLGTEVVKVNAKQAGFTFLDQLPQFDKDFYVLRFQRPLK